MPTDPTNAKSPPHALRSYYRTFIVLGAVLLLQGCVYLRLLDVKSQLSDFDRSIKVEETASGLQLSFRKPTLREDDLRTIGILPSERSTEGPRTEWVVQMRKRYKSKQSESGNYDLRFKLLFEDELLSTVTLPSRYLEGFPPGFIISSLKALGDSKVLKLKRAVSATYDDAGSEIALITPERVRAALGVPFTSEDVDGQNVLRFRYSKDVDDEEEAKKRYTIALAFDRSSGLLTSVSSRSVKLEYAPSESAALVAPTPR
ncbi:hypothetical protein [Pelagicoccus sp. SDUM812003]|uniref:hypothetical protein n=1 Tax=Pelagicoccus sp. SDUM812003 TaxID=3041267 RepID=UPI00280CDFF1|nr:hypothetical protein [Pelagicoccus sp. SDUM812003]MDQ8204355.1 hypothetical protein [Pelagicoccus sp. SDUM812003]